MKWIPYLSFNGQCLAAFQFYERALGGKITYLLTWGASPLAPQVPAERHAQICHATLTAGENCLQGVDVAPEQYRPPQGFQIALTMREAAEAERIYHALEEGGTVQVPLAETFWAARFGVLTDRFGVPWIINCELTP